MSGICLIDFIGFRFSFLARYICAALVLAAAPVFLLGKAEIAAKTRQVFIGLDERTDFSSTETCFRVVVRRSRRKHPENFQHEFSEARQCVITSRGVKIQRIKREPQQWPLCTHCSRNPRTPATCTLRCVVLLPTSDYSRRGSAHFNLSAHFLDLRRLLFQFRS